MVSSPTTRRTRSRINAAINSPGSGDPNGEKGRGAAAANTTIKKNAASPTANEEEVPSMKKDMGAMETDESDKNEQVKNNIANNNSAAVDTSRGGKNNEPAAAEDRNDGPAKATAAAANNDASTDNTEAMSDTMSSATDNSAPINPVGGAMEVDTTAGEASTTNEKGARQPLADSAEKLSSEGAVPANDPDSKTDNHSNIIDSSTVLQKEKSGSVATNQQQQHQQQQEEGKPSENNHTAKSQSAVIATANKITNVTTEALPSNAAAAAAATAAKLTSERSTNANATSSNNNNNNNNNNSATSENSSSSPNSFSMTLAIGPSDTQRLFVASKAFNEEIQKLRSNKENDNGGGAPPPTTTTTNTEGALEKKRKADSDTPMSDTSTALVQSSPSSPSMVVSTNGASATTMTPSSSQTTLSTHDQIALLVAAAKSTSNPLLSSFVSKMKHKSTEEQETSLLFFLDADKSTKLLMAFDVLSDTKEVGEGSEEKGGVVAVIASTATKADKGVDDTLAAMAINDDGVDDSKVLSRRGLTLLFQSFLTSISTCVHNKSDNGKSPSSPQEVNKSPNSVGGSGGDWTGSEKTAKEISEVAIFAANHLIEYVKKEEQGDGQQSGVDPSVSFDQFGKWYNSGGFSLVPWLELLDLSKWDYTLKTNKNVAIEQVPLGGGGATTTTTTTTTTSSSVKRAKFDDTLTPAEAIGSPTGLFETGAAVGATPQPLPSKPNGGIQSFSAMFGEPTQSRNVVSFDFSGTAAGAFHIDITEENLVMLRQLVTRTGFASLTPQHVESVILKHSRCERRKYGDTVYVISRQQFGKFIRDVVPKEASKNFDPNEIENFSNYFTNFFTCFDYNWSDLKKDEVNAKELMVGFSFLCAGNKSSKLAAAYDMLDVDKNGYLTQRGLMQYLRAYLTMLAGISLLSSNKKTTTQIRKQLMSTKRNDAFLAVENGAKWTLGHFFRAFEAEHARSGSTRNNAVAFEDFAKWYTEGGYAVAPWLELLDLQKFLSLIGDFQPPQQPQPTVQQPQGSPADVLFTFPLAKERSLVVLRDDAHYVRAVVSEMGLLSLTSEDIWAALSKDVTKKLGAKKSAVVPVDQASFVECMMKILSTSKKSTQKSSWANFSPEETLKNFFLSFDLMQVNQVPLNQLMCGLTLLCGGTKSSKLGFAFGLFCGDGKNGTKKIQTLGRGDFIQFFRSFLIVMFSCCNQSLSLSADTVSQYISDTAQTVADAVMAYWKGKKVDKVKFDHFSKWYNEGGFQMAPWLELLDLHKWVLADDEQVPAAAAPSALVPTQTKSAASVPVVHAPINVNAPTVDREMFNSLVASPDPKDKAANMAPAPSPNDNVPPPPDDDLLLNLVDEGDVDMVSLADLCLRTCVFLRFYHSQLISFTYHRTSSYSTNQVVQLKPLLLRSRYLTIMVKLNPIQKTLSNFTYSPTILTEAT
jgi:Ca2+-binding EF-hand superfamily protein